MNVKDILVGTEIALDTNLTDELKEEGKIRELIRSIQDHRKLNLLKPEDKINVTISNNEFLKTIFPKYENYIKEKVGALEIVFNENDAGEIVAISDSKNVTVFPGVIKLNLK